MNIQNWKIFDKKGSFINWYRDSYLQLDFVTDTTDAVSAEGYIITDTSGFISEGIITSPGYNYNELNTSALLTYTFGDGTSVALTSVDVSINFVDVSIFNPEANNVKGIGSVDFNPDASVEYIYPSLSFSGALFLDPVSTKLIETEHLTILEEPSSGFFIRPYDASSSLIFRFVGDDEQIKLFELDTATHEIIWTDEVTFETDVYVENTPITLNIGFSADEGGVYERRLRAYELRDGTERILAEFLVNAQAIPQDERFDVLIQNFAPEFNPKNFPKMFSETDINEEYPDWKVLNPKGKNIMLDFNQITPYIGTYKALINTMKWLGYDNIQVKEWFKDVKNSKKIALDIPFNAADRATTILYFNAEERRNLKKLNELTLIYQINRETGEFDAWGMPITENVFEYNPKEIVVKLNSLKTFLEKNVIGVNARVVDITGEFVFFERFKNLIYGVQKKGLDIMLEKKITPITMGQSSELVAGDASISLSLLELEQTKIQDLNYNFRSLIAYGYNQDTSLNKDGIYEIIELDSSAIDNFDASLVRVGPTFKFPDKDLNDIMWKATLRGKDVGVLDTNFVTTALFIYENEIRYYDPIAEESTFLTDTNISISISQGYFRNVDNDVWTDDQIQYSLYPDPCIDGYFFLESSVGIKTAFTNIPVFNTQHDGTSTLTYNFDPTFGDVPLLKFKNYTFTDGSGNFGVFEGNTEFILDLVDGVISMDVSSLNSNNQVIYKTNHIDFDYDASIQIIKLNTEYTSGRIALAQYDPSIYYYNQEELKTDTAPALVIDNSVYKLELNHIGDYEIELFSWDGWNTNYYNPYYNTEGDASTYTVWTKFPELIAVTDNRWAVEGEESSIYSGDTSINVMISNNLNPVFDREIHLQGLELKIDGSSNEFLQVPSITFFQDVPEVGSISRLYNLTEKIDLTVTSDASVWLNQGAAPETSSTFNKIFFLNDSFYGIAADKIISSVDGITWGIETTITGDWLNAAYGNGVYVVFADGSTGYLTSPNGTSWTAQEYPHSNESWSTIAFGNGKFVLGANNTTKTATSVDGFTWVEHDGGAAASDWHAMTFGDDLFVMTANSGVPRIQTSTDGSTWTGRLAAQFNSWDSIAYGNGLYVSVAFDDNGSNNVMWSADAITWTGGAAVNNQGWQEVTYGNGLFVSTSALDISTGTPVRVMTSTDGSTWTPMYSGITEAEWTPVAYGNSKFISIAVNAKELMISHDKMLNIDPDFMSFAQGDSVNAILFNKKEYSANSQMDVSIATLDVNNNITVLPTLPLSWFSGDAYIYMRNITERQINRDIGDPSINYTGQGSMVINVSDYTFQKSQLVSIIVRDVCTGYDFGSSYKVTDVSAVATSAGVAHAFDGRLSDFIIDNSARYTITVKHAFNDFFSTQLNIMQASEVNNKFNIYNDDPYYSQNYMDNTFTYVNILFDQAAVLRQWGENNLHNPLTSYYQHQKHFMIDVSSLLILNAVYDVSTYMLNQKNIWTIRNTNDDKLVMKVWNDNLVYVFDDVGKFNVKSESYDSYGNLKTQLFEGMIEVS